MIGRDQWSRPRVVSVVVDNDSWILPYASDLVERINASGDQATLCRKHASIQAGLVAFYLGCVHITPREVLKRNIFNLVVHESDLPKGRGFAPLTWQILEGTNTIPVCLLEAAEEVDTGDVYLRDALHFKGHELNPELRDAQGRMTVDLCMRFLDSPEPPPRQPQQGESTWYRRRGPGDSEVDVGKTLAEQFDLLRTVDNDRYPAFFYHRGHRYRLRIEKDE